MNEEHVIFRFQQLDLIYAHFGLLYEIISNEPRSNFESKFKPEPYTDGIVGSASTKPVELVMNQMKNLFINQAASEQAMTSSHPT